MPNRRDYSKVMGLLCSIALITVYCVTAFAMQHVPGEETAGPFEKGNEAGRPKLETKPVVMTGAIISNGSDLALLEDSGNLYRLEARESARRFEGKSVRVRGNLEINSNHLFVEVIEPIAA